MKISILSCNTGEGHNSAARALAEAFAAAGHTCELVDALSVISPRRDKIISGAYNKIIVKKPNVFGAIYGLGSAYSATHLRSPVYLVNSISSGSIHEYLEESRPDTVVCTHLFPMQNLTRLRRKGKISLSMKCSAVLTDYTCIPFFRETELDSYFVPHADIAAECVDDGMDPAKLIPTGIPVRLSFTYRPDKATARETLSLPREGKIYLVMTGGMGCGSVPDTARGLLQGDPDAAVCVICGKNEKLKEELSSFAEAESGRLISVGFTTEVASYMSAADVLISKPGGISSTEAAVCGVPFIQSVSIPGCETKNARFFTSRGMSLSTKDPDEAVSMAISLMGDEEKRARMSAAQRSVINPHAAEDIVKYVTGEKI